MTPDEHAIARFFRQYGRLDTWLERGLGLALAVVVFLCIMLAGCTLILDEATAPEIRQVIVPTSLEVTYQRATRAATRMGGTLLAYDPQQYTFTAQVKHVIGLHINIRAVPEGTKMTITGTILPQQYALGVMTEVDEFLRAYWKEPV